MPRYKTSFQLTNSESLNAYVTISVSKASPDPTVSLAYFTSGEARGVLLDEREEIKEEDGQVLKKPLCPQLLPHCVFLI